MVFESFYNNLWFHGIFTLGTLPLKLCPANKIESFCQLLFDLLIENAMPAIIINENIL